MFYGIERKKKHNNNWRECVESWEMIIGNMPKSICECVRSLTIVCIARGLYLSAASVCVSLSLSRSCSFFSLVHPFRCTIFWPIAKLSNKSNGIERRIVCSWKYNGKMMSSCFPCLVRIYFFPFVFDLRRWWWWLFVVVVFCAFLFYFP